MKWAMVSLLSLSFATLSPQTPDYSELIRRVDAQRLHSLIAEAATLDRLGSAPQSLIEKRLQEFGTVVREPIDLIVPKLDGRATLSSASGASMDVYPLWPNGVRTSTCDVSGPLVFGLDGELDAYDGKRVRGSVIVLEFNTWERWRIAAALGARAIVFLEPDDTHRAEAEMKFSALPLGMPRFLVRKRDAASLLSIVEGTIVTVRARQVWRDAEAANYFVVLPGSDANLRDEYIMISAHGDAISIAPDITAGADQSCSLSALLEVARVLETVGVKRSVLLLVTSGHYEAMQGMRQFIERRLQDGWKITGGRPPTFSYVLDLSSGHTGICAQYMGWWFQYRRELGERERAVTRALRERIPEIAKAVRHPSADLFSDAVNNPDGRDWRNHTPGKFATEAEIGNIAGLESIAFITADDSRSYHDTPLDTADRVDIGNLAVQVRTLACILWHAANDSSDEASRDRFVIPYRDGSHTSRLKLVGGFGVVRGQVLTFDPSKSFLPDTPVSGSLVTMDSEYRSYMGVRGQTVVQASGPNAEYAMFGIPIVTAFDENRRLPVAVSAFGLADDGSIRYAIDFGFQGDSTFSSYFSMRTVERNTPVIVFQGIQIDFYDLVDPHYLAPLEYFDLLDARNDGWPRQGSWLNALPPFRRESYRDNALVAFVLPETKFKLVGYRTSGAVAIALVEATEFDPDGAGYVPGEVTQTGSAFPDQFLRTARDLWALNDWRLGRLRRHGIFNASLDRLQDSAKQEIILAEQAARELRHSDTRRHALAAWGFALQAHPKVLSETNDLLNGLLFYLAMLLPFAYFFERLVFGSKRLSHQIMWSAVVFVCSFMALRLMHPAFELAGQTMIVFVAFVMLALSLIVITFVTGKFETGLHAVQNESDGVHTERAAKLPIAMTALNIGISSMRRRKMRTILTSATLVLVMFTVLSFTSVVTEQRFNERDAPGTPTYEGLLVRNPNLDALASVATELLEVEFPTRASVGERVWYFGTEAAGQSLLRARLGTRTSDATAVLGLVANEPVTHAAPDAMISGRWFVTDDLYATILPQSVADQLLVSDADVGRATVRFAGKDLLVVGIVDDSVLKRQHDLDDETLLPADFRLTQQFQGQSQADSDSGFRKFARLDPSSVLIVPARFCEYIGGDTRSVSVRLADSEATADALARIMPRTGLNVYASARTEGQAVVKRFSTVAASQGKGLEWVLIPVAIAAVIVLNTMIASVIERRREIGIFSAVGLSPRQISSIFFAESLVYAILGSVLGYFIAQVFAKIAPSTSALAGISLTYGSLSSVLAVLIVAGVVLMSTIYPSRIAKRIATPAGSEDWTTEPPAGDLWDVSLPFTVSHAHAVGLSHFYAEWLAAYQDYNVGDFVTSNVAQSESAGRCDASATMWLAPFDLGVQQAFSIQFAPTDVPEICSVRVLLTRLSGDPEHWETLNRGLFAAMRKQFLVWRTLDARDAQRYVSKLRG